MAELMKKYGLSAIEIANAMKAFKEWDVYNYGTIPAEEVIKGHFFTKNK